ncbi:MAG TPA: malectin domain-containing carbohydrate-binding protein, partial [Eudoraea sp.]|nr:malectin domain-containing carbohydrate-binding protein [Eudoraea sp.]
MKLVWQPVFMVMFLLGMGPSLLAQADFVATPSPVNVAPSDAFSVTIAVETSTSQLIDLAEIHLSFDPTLLQVTGLTTLGTTELPSQLVAPAFDNGGGTIDYAAGTTQNFPVANFDVLQIDFQAVAEGITSVDYDFTFPFSQTIITFNGSNVLGNAADIPVTIAAANIDPVASFIATPTSGPAALVVNVDASASDDPDGDNGLLQYSWDFGDTNTDTGVTSSNTYASVGQYTITLTVTDEDGGIDTETALIDVSEPTVVTYTITATPGPNGDISPLGAIVNEGDDITFNINPDPGFEVADVLVDGGSVGPVSSFDFLNVQADATISASFSAIPPFQVCIASGNPAFNALGRDFLGDPTAAPPAGPEFSRTNGNTFLGYNGAIAGTTPGSNEELLFQKEIYGGAGGDNPTFLYDVPVANGFYQVDLYFAEVFHPGAGGRVFDVFLQGNLMLDEYDLVDPVKDGVALQTAITRTYFIEVTNGNVNVQIGPASTDNGKLSGLCITEVSNANLHPISNIGDLNFEALLADAQTLNITDPENDVFSITFNGLPASLSYNPATNQLEGTPLISEIGDHIINAIISDGSNSPVTEEFTLTIEPSASNGPPVISAINDINVTEGGTANTDITISDDNDVYNTIFVLYDKSNPVGSTNDPITPSTVIPDTDYSFTDNGGGSYSFSWNTTAGDGRSYLARLTTDDGVNPPVEALFNINVAQPIPATILANTLANPLPWYGGAPSAPFTVTIETTTAQNIGFIDPGDFVEYLIDVPAAGDYNVEFFAGKGNAGPLTVTLSEENGGGFSPIGSFDANNTGWQTYVSYAFQVTFTNAGVQILRLDFSGSGGVNIRDFNFVPTNDTPPTINAIADVEVDEGGTATVNIQVNDDFNPAATIAIFDKSVPGGTNNPFTPAATISGYTFTDNGGGSYTLEWVTAIGDGRSYEARVTADDGANPPVTQAFTIDVAQDIPDVIFARTFANPLPWYGNSPQAPFTVSIEGAGNIGWIDNNEFVEYLVDVPSAGAYDFRVNASNGSGSTNTFNISEENGGGFNQIGSINVVNNGWSTFEDYNTTVTFANSGLQTLRFDFTGGTNIQEFELTLVSGNQPPVVNITSPVSGYAGEQGINISFSATANDPEDADVSASLTWTSDIQGAIGSGPSFSTSALNVGTHVITAEATDNDTGDPKTGSAQVTVIIGTAAPVCDVEFRVNAGGPVYNSASGDFEADQSVGNAGGDAQTGVPAPYIDLTPPAEDTTFGSNVALVSNTTAYPDYLFQTERFSQVANPDNMNWAFPTGNGTFDIDILFNENWTGEINNPRVFDVLIEDNLELDDYRPSVDGTQVNIAKVESFRVTVADGVLNINFLQGTQNPSVKGFSICRVCAVEITDIVANDPTDCNVNDGEIVINATGSNLEYSIDNGSSFQPGNSFTGLTAGTYDIVVREADATSCTASDSATLTAPSAPVINLVTANDPTDCNVNDGEIVINATGSNLEYSIDNGSSFQPGNSFTGLTAGTYDIVVREA